MSDQDAPCTDWPDDDFATVTATDEAEPNTAPDPRGTKLTRWRGLLAPIGKPTGDGRRFSTTPGALTHRDLPQPVKWQRTDAQGHATSVVVGTMDRIRIGNGDHGLGVYAEGALFDPDPEQLPRLAEDVAEAKLLLSQRVIGPSVDLDAMEFHAMPGQEGELAQEGKRPDIEVDKGRISAATLVPIPAFAEARPFELYEVDAEEWAAEQAPALTASVRSAGWADVSVADPDTTWDAPEAVGRVAGWASVAGQLDLEAYGRAFLWHAPEASNVADFVFPVADVIDGQLTLVPAALDVAMDRLELASLPEADKAQMRATLATLRGEEEPVTPEDELARVLAALDLGEFVELAELAEEMVDMESFGPRFDKLVAKLDGKVTDPAAVAATIGRKKYGKKGMLRLAKGAKSSAVKPMVAAMVAAATLNEAVPDRPPAALFRRPEAAQRTPLTVTPDGEVYGHVADWKTCHTGYANQCVRAPKSRTGYAYYDGDVRVGRMSIGGGHANIGLGFQAATAHYDDASTAVAEVRAVDGKHGIWVSGRVLPEFRNTPMEDAFRRHPPSGDWRRIGGALEMVHVLAVNSPGFPVAQVSMVASGAPEGGMVMGTLTAAGLVLSPEQEREQDGSEGDEMATRVARAVVREMTEQQGRTRRSEAAATLVASIQSASADAAGLTRRRAALAAAQVVRSR